MLLRLVFGGLRLGLDASVEGSGGFPSLVVAMVAVADVEVFFVNVV